MIHAEKERFICAICGQEFKTRQGLQRHDAVHTKVKPFVCTECGNRFTQCGMMYKHMRTRHNVSPTALQRNQDNSQFSTKTSNDAESIQNFNISRSFSSWQH